MSPYDAWTSQDRATHAALLARCMDQPTAAPDTWCHERQWRELAAFTAKPDAVNQLAHLYDSDRAGTINLFPRDGVAYNSIVPGRHAGESFHEKDAFAGLWGTPVTRSSDHGRIRTAVIGSVPMAIYQHLTGEPIAFPGPGAQAS